MGVSTQSHGESFPGSPQDATHPPASRPPCPAPHLRVQEEAKTKALKGKEAGGEETGKETCATRQAREETIWRWRRKTKASRHQLCKVDRRTLGAELGYPLQNKCYKKHPTQGCPGIQGNTVTLSGAGYPCYFDLKNSSCAWCGQDPRSPGFQTNKH